MVKGSTDTNYVSMDSLPSNLTNYHIDNNKTICENGGKVSISSLGSDRCTVYIYYEENHDIKINVSNKDYLLSGYTKSLSNCSGITSSWDYKLNGIVVDNISKTNSSCDILFTEKSPSSSELLSTIVDTKGTSTSISRQIMYGLMMKYGE